jgi:hypothetical protein
MAKVPGQNPMLPDRPEHEPTPPNYEWVELPRTSIIAGWNYCEMWLLLALLGRRWQEELPNKLPNRSRSPLEGPRSAGVFHPAVRRS